METKETNLQNQAGNPPVTIDLESEHYRALFAKAWVYIKDVEVEAIRIKERDLRAGKYWNYDVYYDEEKKAFVIFTYVMKEIDGFRTKVLESSTPRIIKSGDYIIRTKSPFASDYQNCYAISAEKFHEMYEPLGNGLYKKTTFVRAFMNDTGGPIRIVLKRSSGDTNTIDGDAACMLVCNVDEDGNLLPGRYNLVDAATFHITYRRYA